jgi:hypothetical protein
VFLVKEPLLRYIYQKEPGNATPFPRIRAKGCSGAMSISPVLKTRYKGPGLLHLLFAL